MDRTKQRVFWPVLLTFGLLLGCAGGPEATAPLRIDVVDAETGQPIPARLEIRGPEGAFVVPESALLLTLECALAPPSDWPESVGTRGLENPHTGTTQFYVDGAIEVDLSPGRYEVRAVRGIEWKLADAVVEHGSEGSRVEISLSRWADQPSRGWWSADDHLHITRRSEADDERISAWLRAEDLHVSNLLQMGTQAQHSVTPQPAFGPDGVVRRGDHLLVPGQEHPRTHFLGHTITLGARERIDERETYIVYETTSQAAREAGGLFGFAHWAAGPANDGLAIDGPRGWISFIEVLQFEFPYYEPWYDMLDLGLRVAPTAGTDFPCGPWSIPGRERFYAQLEGDLSVESWLDAIRGGRTFVTNGPLLDLYVDGVGIGGDVLRGEPGEVRVKGSVRFDPARDRIDAATLVVGGEPVPLEGRFEGEGTWTFDQPIHLEQSSWIALRVLGEKPGEVPIPPLGLPDWVMSLAGQIASGAGGFEEREEWVAQRPLPSAAAHTAPIWVTIAGTPALGEQPKARALAREYEARLDDLEDRLSDARVGDQTIWDWVPYSDGVSEEHLRSNRPALLNAIAEARAFYEERPAEAPTRLQN